MTDIDLGFAEACEGKWLTNAHFPSKIGGKPAWLHLGKLPSSGTLRCSKCGNSKSFLCQVYAPFDDEYNFHRTIYVFVCRTESCYMANDNGCVTVLRSQLSLHNNFYSDVPPPEDGEPLPEVPPVNSKLCVACGCLGGLKCSRCKNTNYCGAGHQRLHWKYHKLQCSNSNADGTSACIDEPLKEIIFPQWEICMNSDGESDDESTETVRKEVNEQEQLEELNKLISTGKAGHFQDLPESELEKYTKGCEKVDDKDFRIFQKECAKNPKQIIRYKRNGQPLWIANPEKTIKDILYSIPDCSLCGSQRQFEFQIMPQMLNYLKDYIVDWGVLAIYTCPKSCRLPEDKGYIEEFAIKQDISTSDN